MPGETDGTTKYKMVGGWEHYSCGEHHSSQSWTVSGIKAKYQLGKKKGIVQKCSLPQYKIFIIIVKNLMHIHH